MSIQINAKILPSSFVCEEKVELVGDITIGSRTLIHPNVKIIAQAGPILIGENNIIEEQVCIINKFDEGEETHNQKVMIIGDNNLFEVGCVSEALKIGDNNILECKARIGRDINVKNGCIIGSKCVLDTCETLQDNTIIFGPDNQRRIASEKPQSQISQLDFLTKLLPSYHKFKKPNVK